MAVCVSTAVLAAEGDSSPEARARVVAPYLDRLTIAVVRVDISRLRTEPLLEEHARLFPKTSPVHRKRLRKSLDRMAVGFVDNGFPVMYIVVDMCNQALVVILPITAKSNVEKLTALPHELPFIAPGAKIEKLDDAVFVGGGRLPERIRLQKPDERPELVEAFRAAGDAPVQLLILPTADHRRVIEEMLPTLPAEIGGGPTSVLTQGMLWMAVGLDPPPQTTLRAVIRSKDPAAARALQKKWTEIARLFAGETVPQWLRGMGGAVGALTPGVEGDRLVVSLGPEAGGIQPLVAALAQPLREISELTWRSQCMGKIKQLGLAMHNYYDVHKSLPAQASYDTSGKPLLSWRVHILPFLEQSKLYKQFHLDEPWDSPHNRKLIDKMPYIYRSPVSSLAEKGRTNYVYPVGEKTVCPGPRGVTFKEITDGTSCTIMIVEANDDEAVIWTKPEDLAFDPEHPAKGLGGLYRNGFVCGFCDGSAHFLRVPLDKELLLAPFTRDGGEVVPWHEIH